MKEDDKLLQIFPIPVLITKYEEDFSEETKYIENLKYIDRKEHESHFRSTDSYLFKHGPLKKIKAFCRESITKYTERVLNSKQRLVVTQCWTNKHPPGAIHHEHVHENSIISGVFYFKSGGKLPPIQFSKNDSYLSSLKLDPVKYNTINAEVFRLFCSPGKLILFPSNLKHSVPVNKSEETRYSLSFNTFCIDILGSELSLNHLDIRRLVHENN